MHSHSFIAGACVSPSFDIRGKDDHITSFRRLTKWQHPTRVGCIVVLVPTKWSLARVMETHVGNGKLVWVATVRTSTGTYKRPTNNCYCPTHENEQVSIIGSRITVITDHLVLAGGMLVL